MRTLHRNEQPPTWPMPGAEASASATRSEADSTREVAEELVRLYRAERWPEVVDRLCADEVVHAEASPPFGEREVAGKSIAHERHAAWINGREFHSIDVRGPYLDGENRFAVYMRFDLTEKASGERKTLEEVGVYEVRGGKIVREDFLY
ncbi:MAG: nuclear transport factor 2 family protein [Myxococcota bacterium]